MTPVLGAKVTVHDSVHLLAPTGTVKPRRGARILTALPKRDVPMSVRVIAPETNTVTLRYALDENTAGIGNPNAAFKAGTTVHTRAAEASVVARREIVERASPAGKVPECDIAHSLYANLDPTCAPLNRRLRQPCATTHSPEHVDRHSRRDTKIKVLAEPMRMAADGGLSHGPLEARLHRARSIEAASASASEQCSAVQT
ncbi:MAG: hypothetical protein AAF689_11930 [Pseudomonadota bacterium]